MKTLKILSELIKFKTISGKSASEFNKAFNFIDSIIEQLNSDWTYREYISRGFKTRVYSHQEHIKNNKLDFKLYLYSNIDVVEGNDELFIPKLRENKFFGRGAVDMKFGLAIALQTLLQLPSELLEESIALIITTDEELGGIDGARYLTEDIGYRGQCIVGPNGVLNKDKFNLELSNKGTIHTKYIALGKSAHGSRPWEGINAIDKIINFYKDLKSEFHIGSKDKWGSTINLGKINGGFATNAVADNASINIDFRYTDIIEANRYYERELELMKKHLINQKELIVDAININVDKKNPIIRLYLDTAKSVIDNDDIQMIKSEGSHDMREFYKVGILPIIFTPRGGDHHTDHEWVNVNDLESLVEINKKFINAFFNSTSF